MTKAEVETFTTCGGEIIQRSNDARYNVINVCEVTTKDFVRTVKKCNTSIITIIQVYSGITRGRVLDGELLYTNILEVSLFAFAYRLLHEDFSSIDRAPHRLKRNLHETVCRQMQTINF